MPDADTAMMIEPESIELANAHGPFSHGSWTGKGLTIGNEEALAGRGAFLVSLIRAEILKRFSLEKLRDMALLDIGCFDGWITCQLALELPFRRVIGIEPRRKNLDKGKMVRKLLGIETRCEFREGSIERLDEVLNGEKADIVICCGVLHHLPSLADGFASLHAVCRHMLFIETICLPPKFENGRLRKQLELKDLPYLYLKPVCGVTGHKLESGYYDGSATRLSVVSNPSVGAIEMFLDVQGFSDIRVVADPDDYASALKLGWRAATATCLTAMVDDAKDPVCEVDTWIADYESGLIYSLLPQDLVETLFARINGNRPAADSWCDFVAAKVLVATGWRLTIWLRWLRRLVPDRFGYELIKNLRFAPQDKIRVELGKVLLASGETAQAEKVLTEITLRLNADWRSVYRAFCLLAWSRRGCGDVAGAERYENLCRLANPQFPMRVLKGSPLAFHSV